MTIYTLYCDRCDESTTHEDVWAHDDYPDDLVNSHPRNDSEVICRRCRRGKGKGNLPDEGAEFWITASVEQGLALRVHPDSIPDGESLKAYLEDELVERRDELAREIADGIRDGQVELKAIESEDMDGYPPFE